MKFFKYGVSLFDARLKKYGGHGHFIARHFFRWRLNYLDIYLKRKMKFEIRHELEDDYYDGYHNSIWMGFILISYGT